MKFYIRSWCATVHLSPRNEVTREQAESIFGVEKVAGRIEEAKKALTGAAGWKDGMQIVCEPEPVVETVEQEVPAAQEIAYHVGDVITGRQILANKAREFVVVQVNRVSIDIKADNGNIYRVKPEQDGKFMHGKDIRFMVKKAA